MSLPHLLGGNSPPRSPHTQPSLVSYFSSLADATGTPLPRRSFSLRPTRRDVVLCLLTLSFAYLMFSAPPTAELVHVPAAITPATGGKNYRIPGWKNIFPAGGRNQQCPEAQVVVRSPTYGESVQQHGLSPAVRRGIEEGEMLGPDGQPWDEAEEEIAEDDELEALSTIMRGHQPGWTLMDRAYVYNGSLYVVTAERSDWPELKFMTSTGLPANDQPGNYEARTPKGHEIIFIKPYEALQLWGPRVYKMDGTTFLINDGQFLDHYYHFAAEWFLGIWRTYMSLDPDVTATGETSLSPPKRFWFLHQTVDEWRDKPKFNPAMLLALFPSVAHLYPQDFADIGNATLSSSSALMFERVVLTDRTAAFHGEWTAPTARTVANALHVGKASRWWWEPIRRQILRYSGLSEEIIDRNLEGLGAIDPTTWGIPALAGPGTANLEPLAPPGTYKPVVTYISRQGSRRRLTAQSHDELVKELEARAAKLDWELVVVQAENMTKEDQFALAGRTTIMLGVHGNGLTHLLWMPATPRSAVIEMFFKGGFARDYQWTAHALGLRHFAIQHDEYYTAPNLPKVDYPEGFQGESITVVGKVVADIIEDRLAGRI